LDIQATFTVGRGEVIKGWDQGMLGMRTAGIRHFRIPAKFAYGEAGDEEKNIPPNAAIYIECWLVGILQE